MQTSSRLRAIDPGRLLASGTRLQVAASTPMYLLEANSPQISVGSETSSASMEVCQRRNAARRRHNVKHNSATGRISLAGDADLSQLTGNWNYAVPQSQSRNDCWGTDGRAMVLYAMKRRIHQGRAMNSSQPTNPRQICENLLLQGRRYNNEHHILPSENAIADRLLARGIELQDAYEELYDKLHAHQPALRVLLGLVLSTAAFWNPEKIQEARAARSDLANVNQQIARKATELATLLEQRSDLHDTSGFSSDTHYHVCGVIEAASQNNYLFQSYVQEKFGALRGQFDLKYWPSLGEFLHEVASDAEKAVMEATDPLTAAATSGTRSSKADFFKALFAAIEENSVNSYGQLQRDFKLTDRTLASLANCALDLGPDDLVDDAYMKRLRQRERSGTK